MLTYFTAAFKSHNGNGTVNNRNSVDDHSSGANSPGSSSSTINGDDITIELANKRLSYSSKQNLCDNSSSDKLRSRKCSTDINATL